MERQLSPIHLAVQDFAKDATPDSYEGRTTNADRDYNNDVLSMENGMMTTVPQNMLQVRRLESHRGTSSSIKAKSSKRRSRRSTFSLGDRENMEMKCCRINVLLVTMQVCLGITITALGFYMQTLSSSLKVRECPFWSGIPLLVAGLFGIYFCVTEFAAYSRNTRAFAIKSLCFILSAISLAFCIVASIFPGIHGSRISAFINCTVDDLEACRCYSSEAQLAVEYLYKDIGTCHTVVTSIKDYMILQCALNGIASGVCLWFISLLWKARYQTFYSGLPHSAAIYKHSQVHSSSKHKVASPPSPITLHRSPKLMDRIDVPHNKQGLGDGPGPCGSNRDIFVK